jgi:hypothetical protein
MVAELLARDPSIEYAEPKYIHTLYDTPNDPLFSSQNAFTRLNAVAGWSLGKGSASVLIATIDGGTYWNHEDLLPNIRINTAEDANKNGVFDAADKNGIDEDGNGFADDVVGWNFTNSTPIRPARSHAARISRDATAVISPWRQCQGMQDRAGTVRSFGVRCIISRQSIVWLRGNSVCGVTWCESHQLQLGRTGGFHGLNRMISTVTDGGRYENTPQ